MHTVNWKSIVTAPWDKRILGECKCTIGHSVCTPRLSKSLCEHRDVGVFLPTEEERWKELPALLAGLWSEGPVISISPDPHTHICPMNTLCFLCPGEGRQIRGGRFTSRSLKWEAGSGGCCPSASGTQGWLYPVSPSSGPPLMLFEILY